MQSICDQLLHEKSANTRELHHLKFIWIERDPVLLHEADFVKRTRNRQNKNVKGTLNDGRQSSSSIAEQLLAIVPPGETTDTELEEQYEDCDLALLEEGVSTKYMNKGSVPESKESLPGKKSLADVIDMQVYLTGNVELPETIPFARIGRPNIKNLFLEMKNEAINSGDNRVAVCVSAPRKLMDHCHKACVHCSDERVRFDFHSETIED